MPTYTTLTDDEKAAIRQAEVRSLEYQMYSLEMSLVSENAKSSPDADKVTLLQAAISEKQTQIAAL